MEQALAKHGIFALPTEALKEILDNFILLLHQLLKVSSPVVTHHSCLFCLLRMR